MLLFFLFESCFLKKMATKSKNTFCLIRSPLFLLAICISFFMSVSYIAFLHFFFLFACWIIELDYVNGHISAWILENMPRQIAIDFL